MHTKQHCIKLHEAKADRGEKINRQIHNYSYTTFSAGDRTTRQKTSKDPDELNHKI